MKTRALTLPRVLVAALAVVAMAMLASCGGSGAPANGGSGTGASASAPGVSTDRITVQNFSFTPSTTTVAAGTTVTWTNNDTTGHDVTSVEGPGIDAETTSTFSSDPMAQGDTFSYTFEKPGTYYYVCIIHASLETMHGVVNVK